MTEPWVPTGSEYDGGATSGKAAPQKPRARRVWEKLTRKKGARHEVRVKAGVGEGKTVTALTTATRQTEVARGRDQAAESKAPVDDAGAGPRGRTPSGASAPSTPPVRSAAKRRRTVRVSEDVLGPETAASHEPSDNGRAGTWEPGLSEAEMRRRIGPIMRYDDDT